MPGEHLGVNEPSLPPLFIHSCERAGSTLLRYIVDTHPELCSPPETKVGETLAAIKVTLEQSTALFVDESKREEYVLGELRAFFGRLMKEYTQKKGKRGWCEKTPLNLRQLDLIDRTFPDARCVCLYRNCMDVVHSSIEAGRYGYVEGLEDYARRNPSNLVAAMVQSWLEKTRLMLAFEKRARGRSFRLRYEDVVFDPEPHLGQMFRFFGVSWDPALLESVFKVSHDTTAGNSGDRKIRVTRKIEQRSVGKGSTVSISHIPPDLLAQMNELLRELDYPQVSSKWDVEPSPYVEMFSRRVGAHV